MFDMFAWLNLLVGIPTCSRLSCYQEQLKNRPKKSLSDEKYPSESKPAKKKKCVEKTFDRKTVLLNRIIQTRRVQRSGKNTRTHRNPRRPDRNNVANAPQNNTRPETRRRAARPRAAGRTTDNDLVTYDPISCRNPITVQTFGLSAGAGPAGRVIN